MNRIAVALAAVLAATYVSPAVGGPNFAASLKSLDKREKRDYASLDRRLKAAVLLELSRSLDTTVADAPMSVQSADHRDFTGAVACPSQTQLTGGGVDWGNTATYEDWHVISSSPDAGGTSWQARVSVGTATGTNSFPTVYAVCARG